MFEMATAVVLIYIHFTLWLQGSHLTREAAVCLLVTLKMLVFDSLNSDLPLSQQRIIFDAGFYFLCMANTKIHF